MIGHSPIGWAPHAVRIPSRSNTYSVRIDSVTDGSEIVPYEAARDHLRLIDDVDRALVELYISAALGYCETVTGRALRRVTVSQFLHGWPQTFQALYHPPLVSVEKVRVRSSAGIYADVGSSVYAVDLDGRPGGFCLASGQSWPDLSDAWPVGPVLVEYTAGYSRADDTPVVPDKIRQAALLMVGHFYENREAVDLVSGRAVVVPLAVDALLPQMHSLECI